MRKLLRLLYNKIKRVTSKPIKTEPYDFNTLNPLGGNGERVDIQMNAPVNFDKMDMYQKSHWVRYQFAKQVINPGDICGDFACGTGYGSILLSDKAGSVTGADLNADVIKAIKNRYENYGSVHFFNQNLLNLTFSDKFDSIISFETLEHFSEANIKDLMAIFSKALKSNGRLIFSTPYMQEKSETAVKMGFHITFNINEGKVKHWLNEAGLHIQMIMYQNYDTHIITSELNKKEFIICVAGKQLLNA